MKILMLHICYQYANQVISIVCNKHIAWIACAYDTFSLSKNITHSLVLLACAIIYTYIAVSILSPV